MVNWFQTSVLPRWDVFVHVHHRTEVNLSLLSVTKLKQNICQEWRHLKFQIKIPGLYCNESITNSSAILWGSKFFSVIQTELPNLPNFATKFCKKKFKNPLNISNFQFLIFISIWNALDLNWECFQQFEVLGVKTYLFGKIWQISPTCKIHFKTRIPFSRRPTSPLLIESQTLTIWPWSNLDLGVTMTSFMALTSDKSN